MYVEDYLCRFQKTFYREKTIFDAVGFEYWEEVKQFNFECQILMFANSKIRVSHFIEVNGEHDSKAEFENTNPEGCDRRFCTLALNDTELHTMTFN